VFKSSPKKRGEAEDSEDYRSTGSPKSKEAIINIKSGKISEFETEE
jgi:hypothetical protein